MQKIIWFILVLLVIAGLFILSSKKDEKKEKGAETGDKASVSLEIPSNGVKMNPENSKLTWTGKKTLLASWIDSGTINLKEGYILMENEIPKSGKAIVDMTTINALKTGKGDSQDMLSKHLSSDDFFNVEMYPTSKLVVNAITPDSQPNTYKATGELTIRDKTNPIEFNFSMINKNIKGELSIDRTLYNVKYGSGKFFASLGDNVINDIFTLSFDINLE